MKRVALFLTVALMTIAADCIYAAASEKGRHPGGIATGQGKIYDSHGQLQQTWKTQPAGGKNVEFFDKHGQLEYYIKPTGEVMNKHGQKIGEIKPGK
jgi:hypothetical protein